MAWRTFLQNAYAERVIGSIRRACLDHVVVIRERSSPGDPVEVRRLLQWDPDPLIVGQGRTRATECAAAEPGQGGGGAPRGWAPSRIPPASGVSQGQISGKHNSVNVGVARRLTHRHRQDINHTGRRPGCRDICSGSGFRYTIRQQQQIPSPTRGYFSATTAATPKRNKVAIDRKRIILRTLRETSSTVSISSQIKHM